MPFQLLLALLLVATQVRAQGFSKTGGGCLDGHSGPNCPRVWMITGGPGWTGQRVDYPVEMICSPSCTDASSPKVCSHILAMHGIYSNPNDQKWLMISDPADPSADTFREEDSFGGPFCISFHKSINDAWEYACGGGDEGKKYSIRTFLSW